MVWGVRSLNKARLTSTDLVVIAAYVLFLGALALATPLQLPEILAIAWSRHYSWAGFWDWTSQALDPSPLACLTQLPFVLLFGASRLGPRIPALLFAAGSCVLFLRLATRAVPRQRYGALILFMLMPVQFLAVTATTQYSAGVFFVLLATISFFDLAAQPGYKTAALFAIAVAACLFADHHSALPPAGAVLFLLRFSASPKERKALWFALGACVAAVALYIPFYIWMRSRANPFWLTEPGLSLSSFTNMTPIEWTFAGGVLLIFAGSITAAVVSFRLPANQVTKRLTLFCLFGAVIVPLVFVLSSALYTGSPIAMRELLYALPGTAVLFMAALDWALHTLLFHSVRIAIAGAGFAVLLACGLADLQFVTAPRGDLALETRYVAPELAGDSCVVFVSENYSKPLFLVFDPKLEERECQSFFHHRVVLASHAYVRSDQQNDAEGFFEALNFRPVKRIRSGGGEIVIMDSK